MQKLPIGKRNNYVIKGNTTQLQILNEYGDIKAVALVDTEDVEKLKKYSFRTHNNGYINTSRNRKNIYLHQIVFGETKEGYEIDHINRNKLDNRKSNLRQCTHKDNAHNRISYNKFGQQGIRKTNRNLKKPYYASIYDNGKFIFLGYYATKEEAIEVRRKAEKEIYKEYAV